MKVLSVEGDLARVELDGISREVSVALLPEVSPGDHVIVHAGFALERLDEEAARETLELFREISEAAGEDG
jgi:hydrogenase expression/formation protein HypC